MLQSIIRIKTQLHFQRKCCQGMKVTPKMLNLFCSNMYCDAKEAEETKKVILWFDVVMNIYRPRAYI